MTRFVLVLVPTLLAGCFYPARIVEPLRTRVVDASTGLPISGATVVRVICDIHDFKCSRAILDRGVTDPAGRVELPGKRKWGLMIPVPGGLPVPNHQIAIWKPGYRAFVFSQYGSVDDLIQSCARQDVLAALREIPAQRRVHTPADRPKRLLVDGDLALERVLQP